MSPSDLAQLKKELASLVAKERITSAHAIMYLASKGGTLLPDGFNRHISDSEYADSLADVEEALKDERKLTPATSGNGKK